MKASFTLALYALCVLMFLSSCTGQQYAPSNRGRMSDELLSNATGEAADEPASNRNESEPATEENIKNHHETPRQNEPNSAAYIENDELQEFVRSFRQTFVDIVQILTFSPGLSGQSIPIVDGEIIGGVEYAGNIYTPVEDYRFPHITSIQDIREAALGVFTESFLETWFYYTFHPNYTHFREIDSVLHRNAFVDGVTPWVWCKETVRILWYEDDRFAVLAHIPFMPPNYENIKIYFVMTPAGWRIYNIE